jgi:8-oxo-dGTP diphosphatase
LSPAGLFRFCPFCGTPLVAILSGARSRPHCPACGFTQWRNPVVGVAAVLFEHDIVGALGEAGVRRWDPAWRPAPEPRVLLVRRSASYRGRWCLPCGYVEYDEEAREALIRETEEETGLRVRPGEVIAVHSNFHEPENQSVGVWFGVAVEGGILRPGDDADRLGLFPPGGVTVPLAFPTDRRVLRQLAGR